MLAMVRAMAASRDRQQSCVVAALNWSLESQSCEVVVG
jgi:hypothetical protein